MQINRGFWNNIPVEKNCILVYTFS